MNVFLNERSLENHSDWTAGLKLFLLMTQELLTVHASVFRDSDFFLAGEFKQRFNALAFPSDQRALLRILLFGNQYSRCWRPQRASTHDVEYACANPALTLLDESGGEAAERARITQPLSVLLISTADSLFGGKPCVRITRASWEDAVEIRNATEMAVAKEFIARQRGHYDRTSSVSPKDFQTILDKDPARFRRTGQVERRSSRRIFQEIATNRLMYVDDAHPGHSAHLEVFSSDRDHLGVADIDTGVLDESRRVEGRRLKL